MEIFLKMEKKLFKVALLDEMEGLVISSWQKFQ